MTSRQAHYQTMTDDALRDMLLLAQEEYSNAPYCYGSIIKEVAAELKIRFRHSIEKISSKESA